MSIKAVEWAMDDAPMLLTEKGKPDTTARHILAVLAEHAHTDGTDAFPSVMRLQYRTGYDERTVRRALRRLEDGGLIKPVGITKDGCTNYTLALSRVRPESDWAALEAEKQREKERAAERKRRSRAGAVTHSDDVTVTDAECVTVTDTDDVTANVTDAESGRHGFEMRDTPDVTDSASGRHGRNAPRTVLEPSLTTEPSSEPSGADAIPGQTCLIEAAGEAAAGKPRRSAKKKPSEPKPNKHAVADELAAKFWDHHKSRCTQSFIQIRGPIRTAIGNGIDRNQLAHALDAVAREGLPVSAGTLQVAMSKRAAHQPYRNPTDSAVYDEDFFAAVPAAPSTNYDEDFFQ